MQGGGEEEAGMAVGGLFHSNSPRRSASETQRPGADFFPSFKGS